MPEDAAGVNFASVTPEVNSHNVISALSLPRCPICRARLLETTTCPRCGSDLGLLVQIAHDANDLERMAVTHLLNGEWALAEAVLVEVQSLRSSELSGQLLAFAEHQLSASTRLPDKQPHSDEPVVARSSLATLDLSTIERYG